MTPFWVASLVALALTPALIPVLRRAGLHDVPNSRSSHATPTPRGGGLAVLAGVAAGMVSSPAAEAPAWWALGAAAALGAVGFVDDARSLPSSMRFVAQVVVACGLGLVIALAGEMARADLLLVLAATVAVTTYVNAFNFMDGVNGISALSTLVAGGWFAWLGHDRDLQVVTLLGALLAGAALGFLPWNARGRIFLGDIGSYGLGSLTAATALLAWGAGVSPLLVVAPLAVYLADTGWALVTRARRREPLTQPHRDHVYQRLVRAGRSHLAAAIWTAGCALLVSITVALLQPESALLAAAGSVVVLAAYLASPRVVGRRPRIEASR